MLPCALCDHQNKARTAVFKFKESAVLIPTVVWMNYTYWENVACKIPDSFTIENGMCVSDRSTDVGGGGVETPVSAMNETQLILQQLAQAIIIFWQSQHQAITLVFCRKQTPVSYRHF